MLRGQEINHAVVCMVSRQCPKSAGWIFRNKTMYQWVASMLSYHHNWALCTNCHMFKVDWSSFVWCEIKCGQALKLLHPWGSRLLYNSVGEVNCCNFHLHIMFRLRVIKAFYESHLNEVAWVNYSIETGQTASSPTKFFNGSRLLLLTSQRLFEKLYLWKYVNICTPVSKQNKRTNCFRPWISPSPCQATSINTDTTLRKKI